MTRYTTHSVNRMSEARRDYHAARALRHAAASTEARRALYAACERAPLGWETGSG